MQEAGLVTITTTSPIELFTPGRATPLLERIRTEVMATPRDISTDAGRKAMASTAYKIARTKTFIDDQRLALVADEKKRLAAIDAEGKRIREGLDKLKEEYRQPLTDWENEEKERLAGHEQALKDVAAFAEHAYPATPEEIQEAIDELAAFGERDWHEFVQRGTAAIADSLTKLAAAKAESQRRYDEQKELERLRAEAEERRQREREQEIARAAAAEATRKAEAERLRAETAKHEAEARAKQEEALRVQAAERAEQARKDAEERHARELQEAAKRAERDREAAIEAERQRAEEAKRKEDAAKAARESDRVHRAGIESAAAIALVSHGCTKQLAERIVAAVAAGSIAHISITY